MTTSERIPAPTRKRLIQLNEVLQNFKDLKITSLQIQKITGWKDSCIRHDLWLIGFGKGVSNGYLVEELRNEICSKLQLNNCSDNEKTEKRNCCIVGLGRIGAALLDEEIFTGTSFCIKAGFDANLYRVEILRSTFPLFPASEMELVIKKEKIEYAILTVESKSAQQMAEKLFRAGIKGIVNMTNTVLSIPGEYKKQLKIENLSVVNALQMIIN